MKKLIPVILGIIGIAIISTEVIPILIGILIKKAAYIAVNSLSGSNAPDGPPSVLFVGAVGHSSSPLFIILGFVILLISIILWIKGRK